VRNRIKNCRKHAIHIVENLIVPKADHPIALALEEFCSPFVIGNRVSMLTAIKLDNQFRFGMDEIRNIVRTEGYLSPKFESLQSASSQS
jgi:hypothetical protein